MAARPRLVGDPDYIDPLLTRGSAEPTAQPGTMEHCHVCGLVNGGCFGFGCSRTRRGIWACQDMECRAEASALSRGTTTTLIAAE